MLECEDRQDAISGSADLKYVEDTKEAAPGIMDPSSLTTSQLGGEHIPTSNGTLTKRANDLVDQQNGTSDFKCLEDTKEAVAGAVDINSAPLTESERSAEPPRSNTSTSTSTDTTGTGKLETRSGKEIVNQHNQEKFAEYPSVIYQYDSTADSCVSSITRGLGEIYPESMYPSVENVLQALPDRHDETSNGTEPPPKPKSHGLFLPLAPVREESDAAYKSGVSSGTLTSSSLGVESPHGRVQIQTVLASTDDDTAGGSTLTPASTATPADSLVWRLMERKRREGERVLQAADEQKLPGSEGVQRLAGGELSASTPSSFSFTTSKGSYTTLSNTNSGTNSSSSAGYAFVPAPQVQKDDSTVPQAPSTGSDSGSKASVKMSLPTVPEVASLEGTREFGSSLFSATSSASENPTGSTPGAFPGENSMASIKSGTAGTQMETLDSMEQRIQIKRGGHPVAGAGTAASAKKDVGSAGTQVETLDSMEQRIQIKTGVHPVAGAGTAASAKKDVKPEPTTLRPSTSASSSVPSDMSDENAIPRSTESIDYRDLEGQQQVGVGSPLSQQDCPAYSDPDMRMDTTYDTSVSTMTGYTLDMGDRNDRNVSNLARATPVFPDEQDLQVAESVEGGQQGGVDDKSRHLLEDSTRLLRLGACIAVVVCIAIIVSVVVAVTKEDNSNSIDTERKRMGDEIKIHLEAVLGHDLFQSNSSLSQQAAWEWLVHEDPLQLNRTAPNLVQRFLMVYFYYTMTGDGPWKDCNPPTYSQASHQNVDLCLYEGLLGDGTHMVQGYSHLYIHYDEVVATRWLTGTHECQWAGLFCNEDRHVGAIHLDKMLLNGTFPTELAHLQSLSSLSLVENQLSGPLPSELANLKDLTYLNLQSNQFSGPFPEEWWDLDSLLYLNLGFNPISVGSIPPEIRKLSNLNYLSLDGNEVTGSMPQEIFELTNLKWLLLRWNEITGTLPTEIALLHETLTHFGVNANQFTGSIPSEIALLTSLLELDLWGSHFTGTIPEEIYFSGMDNLNALMVGDNKLSGSISSDVAHLQRLGYFLLSMNPFLTGTVPTEVGLLRELERFDIDQTAMEGTIPDEVCLLRGLSTLSKLKADCEPLSDGEIPMVCDCCTKCCNQETGVCTKTVSFEHEHFGRY